MGVLYIIFDEGGGGETVPANSDIIINIELKKPYVFPQVCVYSDTATFLSVGSAKRVASLSTSRKNIIVRTSNSSISSTTLHKIVNIKLSGNFNFDNISVEPFVRRVEVRNEEFVLIADNGLPWADGTYPPDAKNRANLTGLHAAPAVINPELETALMGDETNEERVQE